MDAPRFIVYVCPRAGRQSCWMVDVIWVDKVVVVEWWWWWWWWWLLTGYWMVWGCGMVVIDGGSGCRCGAGMRW